MPPLVLEAWPFSRGQWGLREAASISRSARGCWRKQDGVGQWVPGRCGEGCGWLWAPPRVRGYPLCVQRLSALSRLPSCLLHLGQLPRALQTRTISRLPARRQNQGHAPLPTWAARTAWPWWLRPASHRPRPPCLELWQAVLSLFAVSSVLSHSWAASPLLSRIPITLERRGPVLSLSLLLILFLI